MVKIWRFIRFVFDKVRTKSKIKVVLKDPKTKGIRLKESNKSYPSGIMKNILKILLFLFIVELFSCEKQGLIVNA